MYEIIYIIFGSFIMWLGIVGIIDGQGQHNVSLITSGIMLITVGIFILAFSLLSFLYKLYNNVPKCKYTRVLDNV